MTRSIRLCGSACVLPLTHDVHHGLDGMCVNSIGPAPASTHRQLDPQQLVARLRHHAWTNRMDFANCVNLQIVRMSFANYAIHQLAPHVFSEFCEPSAGTHPSTRTHVFCDFL